MNLSWCFTYEVRQCITSILNVNYFNYFLNHSVK